MVALARVVYNIILGALLVIVVTAGIEVFYPSPTEPASPDITPCIAPVTGGNEVCNANSQKEQYQYTRLENTYNSDTNTRGDIIAIITLVIAVLFSAAGVAIYYTVGVVHTGFELGALFTFIYSISSVGSLSGQSALQLHFVDAVVGLLVSLILGYIFFLRKSVHRLEIESKEKQTTIAA